MQPDQAGGHDAQVPMVRLLASDIRRLTVASQHIAARFAKQQDLHHTDLEALIHVMEAEDAGALQQRLGLSSGAVTYLVDRLTASGRLRRDPDRLDRRRVHLRYAPAGRAVAQEFFGPVGALSEAVTAHFSAQELQRVHRYLLAMAEAMEDYRAPGSSAGATPRAD